MCRPDPFHVSSPIFGPSPLLAQVRLVRPPTTLSPLPLPVYHTHPASISTKLILTRGKNRVWDVICRSRSVILMKKGVKLRQSSAFFLGVVLTLSALDILHLRSIGDELPEQSTKENNIG